MTTPTWHPHPTITDYDCEVLGTTDCVYPCAVNSVTGHLERGGPMRPDRAKAWAERVAGLHPTRPGDERYPFYYAANEDRS